MSDDIALVDTNVLVYALYQECEHHVRCSDFAPFDEIEAIIP